MKNKDYLTEEEVKEYLWKEFENFMRGQTIMIGEKEEPLFYKRDVDNFLRSPERRFFD